MSGLSKNSPNRFGGKALLPRTILAQRPANFAARTRCVDTSVNKSLKSRERVFKYGLQLGLARQSRGINAGHCGG
jgi:hypothetical protein